MTPSRNQKDLTGFDLVMPKRLHDVVKARAEKSGMTRSEFVRRVLAHAVGDENLALMPRTIGEKKKNGHARA